MPLPDGFSWEQGAAICETWITAYLELVMLGELKQGQAILIHAGTSPFPSLSPSIHSA